MLWNELRERGMETVSEEVVGGVVVGDGVEFAITGLMGEGEPVRDEVALLFQVLGAESLVRFRDGEGHLA